MALALSISMILPYSVNYTTTAVAAELPAERLNEKTRVLRTEPLWFSEDAYSEPHRIEYVTDSVKVEVTKNQEDPNIYDVTIKFNENGVREKKGATYENWYTSNPFFSFWITNGFDIYGDITYERLDGPYTYTKSANDIKPMPEGYFYSYNVKPDYEELFNKHVYSNLNNTQKTALRNIIRRDKFNVSHTFQVYSGRNVVIPLVVSFKLKRNSNFDATKEMIGGVYKSYDAGKTFVRTYILQLNEVDNPDASLRFIYDGMVDKNDEHIANPMDYLTDGSLIKLTYKTIDGASHVKEITPGDNASVIYNKQPDDSGEIFSDLKVYYNNEVKSSKSVITGKDGKKFQIIYTNIIYDDIQSDSQDNRKVIYEFKEVEDDPVWSVSDLFEYTEYNSNANVGVSTLKKNYEIITGNETVDLSGLSYSIKMLNRNRYFSVNSVLEFNNNLPRKGNANQDSDVFLVNKDGVKTALPNSDRDLGRSIAVGDKLLLSKTLNGVTATCEIPLNIIDRRSLKSKYNSGNSVKESYRYINADESLKSAYDEALNKANRMLQKNIESITQRHIETAEREYDNALQALNGTDTNYSNLEALIRESEAIKQNYKYQNASQETKQSFDNALSAAKNCIDSKNSGTKFSQAEVDRLKNGLSMSKEALDGIDYQSMIDAAVNDIEQKAAQAIEKANTISDEQAKNELINKINSAKTEGINQVRAQRTEQNINTEKERALTNISNIDKTVDAVKIIENAHSTKTGAINNTARATDEEKAQAQSSIDNLKNQGITTVKSMSGDQAVTKANEYKSQIEAVRVNVQKKDSAITELENAASSKEQVINASRELTDEEKIDAKRQVALLLSNAKENVNSSSTNSDVDNAKNNGIIAINSVNVTGNKKTDAISELRIAANNKKDEIRRNTNLTSEEKEAAISQVDRKLSDAESNVNSATTNSAVDSAKQTGINEINGVRATAVKKPNAITELENAAAAKIQEINAGTETDEAKNEAKRAVNQKLEDAKANVNSAENNGGGGQCQDKWN